MPKYETPEKIQAARVILLHKMPYLASALFAVTFVPNPHVQTMGIDRWWRVYYNPDQLEKWTIGEVAAVILHEVHHVLHDHHDRSVARGITPEDHLRWNIAADIPINDGLTEGLEDKAAASHMTIKLPEGCVYSSTFGFEKGLLAETYFDLLESKVVKVYVLANGSEGSGAGTGKVPGEAEEGEPKPGETLAVYNLVYTDGSEAALPVRYQREAASPEEEVNYSLSTGNRLHWNDGGQEMSMWCAEYANPFPERGIARIELRGTEREYPFYLFGVTLLER